MEINVISLSDSTSSHSIALPEAWFDVPYNEPLIHQVVTAYMAGARQGTKAQKTRAEVRGGGAKPWKQKGSGRARAGTIRSPLWRKGGVTFAAKPRSFAQKVNKKMYRGAMRSVMSEWVRQGLLTVVDSLAVSAPKTKAGLALLNKLGVQGRVLLITDHIDENLWLSVRNLHGVYVLTPDLLDPVTLIHVERVVITEKAIQWLTEGMVEGMAEAGMEAAEGGAA